MKKEDKTAVLNMMRTFYNSPALYTNGSEEIFAANFDNSVNDNPFLESYIISDDSEIIGYTMLAKSFSTEFGKECIWFEDLYLKEEYRNKGIIPQFIDFIKSKYQGRLLRLEVEKENKHAVHVYENAGFKTLPYAEYYID
ncbi:MAG: GNAT family N-acetyltransferase [Candidatus Gastranaerophilales bacterium]|nr:GNAT family N-acetyltransferase [Candidatus Gastranaerophilales bacterium]